MANKIIFDPETTIVWQDSDQTPDEDMTLGSLGSGVGRNGAIHDWGATPRSLLYHLKFRTMFGGSSGIAGGVRIFIRSAGIGSSATNPTNDDGDNVVLSAQDKLRNLQFVGFMQRDENSALPFMSVELLFRNAARHFGPVVFNDTLNSFDSVHSESYVEITPIPSEIQ